MTRAKKSRGKTQRSDGAASRSNRGRGEKGAKWKSYKEKGRGPSAGRVGHDEEPTRSVSRAKVRTRIDSDEPFDPRGRFGGARDRDSRGAGREKVGTEDVKVKFTRKSATGPGTDGRPWRGADRGVRKENPRGRNTKSDRPSERTYNHKPAEKRSGTHRYERANTNEDAGKRYPRFHNSDGSTSERSRNASSKKSSRGEKVWERRNTDSARSLNNRETIQQKGAKQKTGYVKARKEGGRSRSVEEQNVVAGNDLLRLNRYISNAGICSRREADNLIKAGLITVNGKTVVEMGYQVRNNDDVRFNGERLSRERKVYILMNKPKDTITTLDDPGKRTTVMDVLGRDVDARVFPVGRLDRNTTGVLILTNDGELSQRLTHPKYEVQKVYRATLNKVFKGEDFWQLSNGVELEDGFMKPDEIAYPDPKDKTQVGLLIHSGRNRIIHRMFESLGYLVDKLDRVAYGEFVKTRMKRGEWRYLDEKEIKKLKRMAKLG